MSEGLSQPASKYLRKWLLRKHHAESQRNNKNLSNGPTSCSLSAVSSSLNLLTWCNLYTAFRVLEEPADFIHRKKCFTMFYIVLRVNYCIMHKKIHKAMQSTYVSWSEDGRILPSSNRQSTHLSSIVVQFDSMLAGELPETAPGCGTCLSKWWCCYDRYCDDGYTNAFQLNRKLQHSMCPCSCLQTFMSLQFCFPFHLFQLGPHDPMPPMKSLNMFVFTDLQVSRDL